MALSYPRQTACFSGGGIVQSLLSRSVAEGISPNPPGPSLHAKLAGHAPRREVRQSVRRFALPPMVSHP